MASANRLRSSRLKTAVGRDALGAPFPNTPMPFLNAPMLLSDAPMSLLFAVQRGTEGIAPYERGAVALNGISFK